MSPQARYLHIRPQGVVAWLTRAPDARQPDQRLFRALLRQPHNTMPVSMEQLSECSGLPRAQVAQSLFVLLRQESIRVSVNAPAPHSARDHPATDIPRQLQRLCDHARGAAVLADPDGLCMASHGVARDDAQGLAAGGDPWRHAMVRSIPLYIARQRPCRLYVTVSSLLAHEALVGLAHNLCELLPEGR